MIHIALSNDLLQRIIKIEKNCELLQTHHLPEGVVHRMRRISRRKSTYASNRIEGNPLSEEDVERVLEKDPHGHFLKPEQEIRNYYQALELLEGKMNEDFSQELILQVQAKVVQGSSKEKIGLRGAMPPGVPFAVYDSNTGNIDYIPPEYCDVPQLLEELVAYVRTSDDHPLIKAAVVHYQLVTIHPFEDGNGRTARLLSGYLLEKYGYGFLGIGSLDEYFAYDPEEYYSSLQMGLPALYYSGRNDPPHPEIWITYFLRMVELYSAAVLRSVQKDDEALYTALSHLRTKERRFLAYLLQNRIYSFAPAETARVLRVSNRTVINWSAELCRYGFLEPVMSGQRIRKYRVSDYSGQYQEEILAREELFKAGRGTI